MAARYKTQSCRHRAARKARSRAAQALGFEGNNFLKPIVKELAALRIHDPRLARVYQKEASRILDEEKGETAFRWQMRSLRQNVLEKSRMAVYREMGVELDPIDYTTSRATGMQNLYSSASLFRIVVHGEMREKLLELSSMDSAMFSVTKTYGSAETYMVGLNDCLRAFFVKEGSMAPDILAGKLLRSSGTIVPEIRTFPYIHPFEPDSEFGVIQSIYDVPGVRKAVSLRALARDMEMVALVSERFDDFCEILGRALEACRLFGIQDRHSRNLGIAEMDDGGLAIFMFDLDLVACYPESELFRHAYAGQLGTILQSLDFAFTHGELLRDAPDTLKQALIIEDLEEKVRRRRAMCMEMSKGFLRGAEHAQETFSGERREEARERLIGHHGKPVGWRHRPDDTERTAHPINGKRQELLKDGPNSGRFLLDWRGAVDSMASQLRISAGAFWEGVLETAPGRKDSAIVY